MTPIEPVEIRRLLVPLDGSRLAETALPAAMALARRLEAAVTLLHVLERDAPATIHGERHLTSTGEAGAYLNGIASRFADAGIPVEIHAHPSPEQRVAASIAAHAVEIHADLVVLCAHGRGGLRGWFSGAIAQQVVQREGAPVLLIRPASAGTQAAFTPSKMLIALDGTAEGELVLPVALTIARGLEATLYLLMVVETLTTVGGDRAAAARLLPTATNAVLELASDEAGDYLAGLRDRLGATGVPIETIVGRGDAAQAVNDQAARLGDCVVALATHGHAGFDALWSGSVGSKVVARAGGPLLLVRATGSTTSRT